MDGGLRVGAVAAGRGDVSLAYAVVPLLAWVTAGSLKFALNSVAQRRLAFGAIGYGGCPSNHSAIVCSTAALIALREGMDHPAFGVSITLAFIVLLDAGGLRRHVGLQARVINQLQTASPQRSVLRERMGHRRRELLAGAVVGGAVAWLVQWLQL